VNIKKNNLIKNKRLILFVTSMFMFLASSAVAEIYQWKDKNGNVHFSDKPNLSLKNGQEAKQLTLKKGNNVNFAKTKDSDWQKDLEDENTLKTMDKNAQAREKLKAQKRQVLCEHWRSRIEIYKQAGSIAIVSPQGERHYLNESERKEQSKTLLNNVRSYCR